MPEILTYACLDGEREFLVQLNVYYSPYRAERGPTYACGGEPAEPEELFAEEIWLVSPSQEVDIPQHHRLFDYFDEEVLLKDLMGFNEWLEEY